MNLQEQYKKETNLEAYELDTLNNGYDNFKYVKWLEAKLTLTDVVDTSVCDEPGKPIEKCKCCKSFHEPDVCCYD
jgi:hypothetical protein